MLAPSFNIPLVGSVLIKYVKGSSSGSLPLNLIFKGVSSSVFKLWSLAIGGSFTDLDVIVSLDISHGVGFVRAKTNTWKEEIS